MYMFAYNMYICVLCMIYINIAYNGIFNLRVT